MADWQEWFHAPSPVPADQRVECVLYDGRRAQGVAVAFNWRDGRRSDVVERWRIAPPKQES